MGLIFYSHFKILYLILYRKIDDKKWAEKAGEEILCAILYLDISDKSRFDDLKKRVENDYVLNKAE